MSFWYSFLLLSGNKIFSYWFLKVFIKLLIFIYKKNMKPRDPDKRFFYTKICSNYLNKASSSHQRKTFHDHYENPQKTTGTPHISTLHPIPSWTYNTILPFENHGIFIPRAYPHSSTRRGIERKCRKKLETKNSIFKWYLILNQKDIISLRDEEKLYRKVLYITLDRGTISIYIETIHKKMATKETKLDLM